MVGRSGASALCIALASKNALKKGASRKKRCFLPGEGAAAAVKVANKLHFDLQGAAAMSACWHSASYHPQWRFWGWGIKPQRDETTHSRSLLSPWCHPTSGLGLAKLSLCACVAEESEVGGDAGHIDSQNPSQRFESEKKSLG